LVRPFVRTLLRSPVVLRSLSSAQHIGFQFKTSKSRSFFTRTKPVRAAELAVKHSDKKEEEIYEQEPWVEQEEVFVPEHQRSIPEFIKEWGWWPFTIFTFSIGLGKELYFADANLAILVVGTGISLFLYFAAADAIEEYANEVTNNHFRKQQVSWDLLTTSLQDRMAIHKADIATEAFVKDLALHWRASEIEAAKYASIKAKHDARNEIVAQLEAVARKEKAVTAAGTKVVASALRRYVRQIWSTPDKKLKEDAFNLALNNLLNPQPIDPKNSPVYGHYINYLHGNVKVRA